MKVAEKATFDALINEDKRLLREQSLSGRKISLTTIHAKANKLADPLLKRLRRVSYIR